MEFDKLIKERYSVRKFKPERVKKEDLEKILQAGLLAPTGCNFQPQRILVINSEDGATKIKDCTKCHFNAPTFLLVCHNKEESWVRPYDKELSSPVDATIVATHMMLKAHDIGVGCCWVMHFNPFKMRETFNIPKNLSPVALLVMGYPDETAKPLDMHYQSKSLKDVVLEGSF